MATTITLPDNESRVLNVIGTTFYCMAVENILRGIFAAVVEVRANKSNTMAKLIVFCNLLFAIKYVIDAVKLFGPQDWRIDDFGWQFAYSASYHLSMIAFDCFLLYKCWLACPMNRMIHILTLILFVNRCGWAIADLSVARMDCSDSVDGCYYVESKATIIGAQVSDVAVDLFCTLAVLILCRFHLKSDIRDLFVVIMEENVIRSAFLFAFGCITIWAYVIVDPQSELLSFIYFYLPAYIYAVALNSEFYFKEQRQKALNPLLIVPAPNLVFDIENQKIEFA
ncbi:UNVERIFIED_CONTAM: hypothetical protein HDU68_009042 [Siphonaria sp. JEL0065]|nr:hypothetical protein HDU68_009042 [Siphonaria sp. JEL0065]